MRIEKFRKDSDGTAAIEFAIVAPVFLFLLFAFVAYGIYFGAAHSVQQLAADAARASVAGLDLAERRELVNSYVATNASGYPLLAANEIEITIEENADDNNQLNVSVKYNAESLPIWNLFKTIPLPGKTIYRTSTIRTGKV